MITRAISVLSAVEGLKVAEPSLGHLVVPITAAIIVGLFMAQRLGTAAVGRLFGPVMIAWFLTIGACGVRGIADHPEILRALSPPWCWPSRGPKPCTPTWATSAARRSPARG
jgi:KUP system potassium uptake protein